MLPHHRTSRFVMCRERYSERSALANFADYGDGASEQLCESLRNRQPKPGSFVVRVAAPDLSILVEDGGELLGRYPFTRIRYGGREVPPALKLRRASVNRELG